MNRFHSFAWCALTVAVIPGFSGCKLNGSDSQSGGGNVTQTTDSISSTFQINSAHSGQTTFDTSLELPGSSSWSVNLGASVSYPLIAGQKVFVTISGNGSGGYGTRLYALDLNTGSVIWGPIAISGTYFRSGITYDNGKVFVVNYDGLLRSYSASTGAAGWSVSLPGQYSFSAPPTAADGVVYVGGSGSGGTLYAVNETNGALLWSRSVANGDQSSPTLSSDGVFVSYPCHVYKFAIGSGTQQWLNSIGCSGGGGKTSVFANGALYVRDSGTNPMGSVLSATSGNASNTFGGTSTTPIPAVTNANMYWMSSGSLMSLDLSAQNVQWTYAGDGHLVGAPIVVNDTVFVESSLGTVFAVDAFTGSQVWSGAAGAAINAPDEQNVSAPLAGMGAGEKYLVVPAGSQLTAWNIVH